MSEVTSNCIKCKECLVEDTRMWHKDCGEFICHFCHVKKMIKFKKDKQYLSIDNISENNKSSFQMKSRMKIRNTSIEKAVRNKSINKNKDMLKSKKDHGPITGKSEDKTCSAIFYKGDYFQVGDIISIIDQTNRSTYFAQCTAFMVDIFAQKSVSYQWLLPTEPLKDDSKFVPGKFRLGPTDNLFHDMESIKFVCSAPSDYYKPLSFYSADSIKDTKTNISVLLS